MQCREARHRLESAHADSSRSHDELHLDRELRDHLRTCSTCAKLARSSEVLRQLFAAASEDDRANVPSLANTRVLMEARDAAAKGMRDRSPEAPRRSRRHTWIPVGAGLAVAAAVLVLVAVVPFGFNQTVSYDVTFHGVQRDIAEDNERLCDVFYDIGLRDAAIDLRGCDTTCQLVVFDLKSEQEVQLAVALLQNLSASDLTVRVLPVRMKSEQTLLGRASDQVL